MILFTSSIVRPCSHQYKPLALIVGLDVELKGPFPLVGESELACNFWCDFTPKIAHDFLASVASTTFLVIIGFYLRTKSSSSLS
jgi:hypothetical protein